MESEEPEIKSKQASKRDRTLGMYVVGKKKWFHQPHSLNIKRFIGNFCFSWRSLIHGQKKESVSLDGSRQ